MQIIKNSQNAKEKEGKHKIYFKSNYPEITIVKISCKTSQYLFMLIDWRMDGCLIERKT